MEPAVSQIAARAETISRATTFGVGLGFLWGWTAEQPDGVFAIAAADLAELVQDASS
jgi:hypothetical protein